MLLDMKDRISVEMTGAFYVLSAILLWSSLGVVIRLSGADVHVLIFYSSVVSLPLLAIPVFLGKRRRALPNARGALTLLVIGPITLINTFTFFYALKNTTISNAVFTHYIAPVAVAFLAPVFLKEKVTKRVMAAIIIATIGLAVLLDVRPSNLVRYLAPATPETLGVVSGLFSGLAYAVLVLVVRALAPGRDPLVLCLFQNAVISLILLPFAGEFPFYAAPHILIMGAVHSTLAPALYFRGLALTRASRAAVLGYIEPVAAIALGVLFLGERPGLISVLGGALVLIAGYITIKEE